MRNGEGGQALEKNESSPLESQKKTEDKSRAVRQPLALRILLLGISVLLILILSFVTSAFGLKMSASSLLSSSDKLQEQIISGDMGSALTTVQSMQTISNGMASELNSPLWSAACAVGPELASDIQSLRSVAAVLSQVCSEVLGPLVTNLQETTSAGIMKADGSINLEAVQTLLGLVNETSTTMQTCAVQMAKVPDMNISELQGPVASAKEKFAQINELYQQAASFTPIANKLLGGDGTRNYLIVAQNSAETRSLGGFPGALGLLTIKDGAISLGEFGTPYELLTDEPVVELTDEEYTLFGNGYNDINNPRNDALFVDYTRVANIWAQSFATKTGIVPDGVVSVTPAVVQDLLTLAEPVSLSDGTLVDGTNATKVLQHDLYWDYLSENASDTGGNSACDALFAEAAKGAFHNIVANLNITTLKSFIQVVLDDIDKGTFMVWLTDEAGQKVIEPLKCSGALSSDETSPEAGVFVGFASGSKLGWYLDCDVTQGEALQNSDGSSSYTVTVTLRNALTEDEAAEAGTYIAGLWGGSADVLVHLTAPAGGTISEVLCSSRSSSFELTTYEDEIELAYNPGVLWIEPEGTVTLTYIVTTSPDATSDLTIRQTPTLTKYRQQN